MSIAALGRRLDKLEEIVTPVKSWDDWDYEELDRYSKLLKKELAALDGGEPLTSDEERERQALSARAPHADADAGLTWEQMVEKRKALDAELAALESGEVWC